MKVLLDACVPRPLRRQLPNHEVKTAQELGWGLLKNGDLLRMAEGQFEVLITTDQNLKYQQNLKGRKLAIIVLSTNFLPEVIRLSSQVADALTRIQPGDFVEIQSP